MAGLHQVSSLKMSTAVLLQFHICLWYCVYSNHIEIFRLTFPIYSLMVKELYTSNIATLMVVLLASLKPNCVQAVLKQFVFLR